MARSPITAALKTALRPLFHGLDRDVAAIKVEAENIRARAERIDRRAGMDRALDALTRGKGQRA